MAEQALGSATVAQIGIVVRDIESRARAWANLLGLPMPAILATDPVDRARTEYHGAPSAARAKLAFFHLGQVDVELIEPVGGPRTWRDQLDRHGESIHHLSHPGHGRAARVPRRQGRAADPARRVHGWPLRLCG